ncbi:MAG TPA: GDCCVxC domain-containing (seleno)protein [Gaiellaceae bacterium]|nr:GDCCVxC domain-containing (seleno)protein [Gaiellaceae bacterium]
MLGARITCPQCGFSKVERMPTDACQYLYRCEGGRSSARHVFCSYADAVCPPKQHAA